MPTQPSLFANDPGPSSKKVASASKLVVSAFQFGAGPMSPTQKRFNQLLSQTETLAKKIEDTRKLADAHRMVAERTLAPLEKARVTLMRQMAVWLDERLQRKGLMAKEKLAALTTLLKDRVTVLTQELYAIERQMIGEFGLPMFTPLSAAALRRHLTESELNLHEEIAMMTQDLALVQDDARLKRWLREQQKISQDDFDPLGFF